MNFRNALSFLGLIVCMSFIGVSELRVSDAHGYAVQMVGGQPLRWGETQVSYKIHPAGSDDINDGSDISAVQAGFQAWQGQGCSYIQLNYAGSTNNLNVTSIGYASNSQNEVVWLENSCNNNSPSWCFGPYVLGVTAPLYYQDGMIVEADIAFNGLQSTWSTSGVAAPFSNQQDVMNVALHEEGHFIGLQHVLMGYSPDDPPTMITTADPNLLTATLHADDVNGVCFLYPVGGGFSCTSDDDCPYVLDEVNGEEVYTGMILCENGTCGGITNPTPGNKQFGEVCGSNLDCAGDMICEWTQDSKVCTSECVPNQNNCPSEFACVPYNNAPNLGICLPTGGSAQPGSKQVGEACASSTECSTGLCVAEWGSNTYLCRTPCDTASPVCGAAEACYALQQGSTSGACLPTDDPNPGLKENGEACDSANVCQSGLCVGDPDGNGYFCRGACNTTNGAGCLEGEQCVQLTGAGTQGACIPGSGGTTTGMNKPTGAPCTDSGQCASQQCVSFSGEEDSWFCTATCVAAGDCPCGMECVATTTMGNVCAPGEKVACIPDGNACAFPDECISGKCVFGVCTRSCTVLGGGCGPGEGCVPDDEFGNGYCGAIGPGLPGSACAQHTDCSSLVCSNAAGAFLCAITCDPNASNTCGSGKNCTPWQGIGVCVDAPDQPNPNPTDSGSVPATDPGTLGDTGSTNPGVGTGSGGSSGGCSSGGSSAPWRNIPVLLFLFFPVLRRRFASVDRV